MDIPQAEPSAPETVTPQEQVEKPTEIIQAPKGHWLAGKKEHLMTKDEYSKELIKMLGFPQGKPMNKLEMDQTLSATIKSGGSNYAFIMYSNSILHVIPFDWYYNSSTNHTWAVFDANAFYGHQKSKIIWKRFKDSIVVTPFSKESGKILSFGKSFWAKFDQATQMQMSMSLLDTKSAETVRLYGENMVSQVLTLKEQLTALLNPKWNWKLIMLVIIIAAVAILAIIFWPNIQALFGNFANKVAGSSGLPLSPGSA